MSDPNLLNGLMDGWQGYSITFAVLIASVAGSTHCIAMCGPIAVLLKNNNGNIHLYNIGRLITYLFLGFLAGLFGEAFLNNHYGVISIFSTIVISAVLLYLGYNLIRNKSTGLHMPGYYTLILKTPLRWIFKLNIYMRSILLGVINGFAPCGWLYVFVLASVTLKNSYQGALLMFFFWLGTVPTLTFLSYVSNRLINFLPGNFTRIAGFILLFVGLFNLVVNFLPLDEVNMNKHTGHSISLNKNISGGQK